MAYMDFVRMYAQDVKRTPESLLADSPLTFPMSTNERGQSLIDFLGRSLRTPMKDLRVLDVGCAYGGYCLALRNAGAKVVGIDVAPKLIEYARENFKSVADDIETHIADASSVAIRKLFKKGQFNLIVLNDVLEHIYDTTTLIENLDYLLDENGVVFFKVPNGHSPRFVLSEGHRKIFALTILDPDCWFHLYPKRASIFYRPFPYFTSIFEHFGFGHMTLFDEEDVLRRFNAKKLRRQIRDIFVKAKEYEFPDKVAAKLVRERIVKFRDDFDYEVESKSEGAVVFKYGSYFFTGFAARKPGMLKSQAAEPVVLEGFPNLMGKQKAA